MRRKMNLIIHKVPKNKYTGTSEEALADMRAVEAFF